MRKPIYIFSDVAQFWGKQMPMIVMEELAALSQAISKAERNGLDAQSRQNLIDEIGYTYIAIRAIMVRYGITEDEIGKRVDTKLFKKFN